MTLSQSEIRGPWVVMLECMHTVAISKSPGGVRKCASCHVKAKPIVAYYGKRPIPIDDLVKARRDANGYKPPRPKITRDRWYRNGHHRDYRAALIAEGWTDADADRATMDYRWGGLRQRAGEERYRRTRDRLERRQTANDGRYKPQHVDPVLKGVARATGETARAIKAGHTITDWQYRGRT